MHLYIKHNLLEDLILTINKHDFDKELQNYFNKQSINMYGQIFETEVSIRNLILGHKENILTNTLTPEKKEFILKGLTKLHDKHLLSESMEVIYTLAQTYLQTKGYM